MAFWSCRKNGSIRKIQLVIFKPLSYCFKETIWFDVKASFVSRTVSRLIKWDNKPGDTAKEFWEKAIQFHGTFHGLKITNWIKQREDSRNIKKDCERSLKTIFDIIECNSKKNKTTELWFARYHIYAGENHSQGT